MLDPRGSILGSLLFCIYINDLPDVLDNCSVDMCAVDVQLYKSIVLIISDYVLKRSRMIYGKLTTAVMLMDFVYIPLNIYCSPGLREHLMCQILISEGTKLILLNRHLIWGLSLFVY